MGIFDTVYFKCPKCDAEIEEQTKAGDCGMRSYNCDSVPHEIGHDLVGIEIRCLECETLFQVVEIKPIKSMKLGLVKI